MRLLHEGGFQVISLGQLVNSLRSNQVLPSKSVVITFDDGLQSVYASAFPVLERFGFPATVFLVAGYCGKSNNWPGQPTSIPCYPLMTWSQIRELRCHGLDFGAHTFTHPRLDQVPPEELEHELLDSKKMIEDQLGHKVSLFSYPYGRYNRASAGLVGQVYEGACTTQLGMITADSDPLALARVDAYSVQQPHMFRLLSSPIFATYLGVRRPVRSVASAILAGSGGKPSPPAPLPLGEGRASSLFTNLGIVYGSV
jgi:peptidoglycan/xylan/chitin deacetylase (PgdA/CDA1 family)